MKLYLLIVASLACLTHRAEAADKYYRAVRVFRNETGVLPCWELNDPSHLQFWITPGELFIRPGGAIGSDKYMIGSDSSLIVLGTIKNDSGIYKCVSLPTIDSEFVTVEAELQVIDTSYIPELDDWQANLIRGVIAAASTAVFFIAACGLKQFNWHERHSKGKLSRSSSGTIDPPSETNNLTEMKRMKGVHNLAMSPDADEVDTAF